MSEAFIGEIRMFGGNFAPRGWAFCDGQLLAISENDALFSLLGTTYGGDGRTTFGLPDLRGRVPIHQGSGPGLSPRSMGSRFGSENETLTVNQLPSHSHPLQASSEPANSSNPQGQVLAEAGSDRVYRSAAPDVSMAPTAISRVGGSQSHTNMMPFQCVNFIIALFGVFPSQQ